MPSYEDIRERFDKEGKLEFFQQGVDDACNKIARQTDYDNETALNKLKEHNMDITSVIREWIGVETIKKPARTSNQMVFDEFRTFLDTAALDYYNKKELEEKKQMYLEKLRESAKKELEKRKEESMKSLPLNTIDEDSK
jgi:hypothetical protein